VQEGKRVAKSEEAIKARRLDDWIKRVAQGDQTALGTLYDSTSPLVHGLVRRIVGDSGLAEDVTLDVYMQVWQQAKRYDPERGSAMAWLMTLASPPFLPGAVNAKVAHSRKSCVVAKSRSGRDQSVRGFL
jgi:Sigma-70 region 2